MKIIETENMYIAHDGNRIINVMMNIAHSSKKDCRTYDLVEYKNVLFLRVTKKFKDFLADNKIKIEDIDENIVQIFIFEMTCKHESIVR
jgi:hypothetical protein